MKASLLTPDTHLYHLSPSPLSSSSSTLSFPLSYSCITIGSALSLSPSTSPSHSPLSPFFFSSLSSSSHLHLTLDCDEISPLHLLLSHEPSSHHTGSASPSEDKDDEETTPLVALASSIFPLAPAHPSRYFYQVFGATGVGLSTSESESGAFQTIFPSPLKRVILNGTSVAFELLCSHSSHRHIYQLTCDRAKYRHSSGEEEKGRIRGVDPFQGFHVTSPVQNDPLASLTFTWSDAERQRFQRGFIIFGLHGLDAIKNVGALNKKHEAQIVNYASSFLIQARELCLEDDERKFIDAALWKEQWRCLYQEPTLSHWAKMEGNAAQWVKRLRSIALLEDLMVRAQSEDVDILSLLPANVVQIHESSAPAPWWNNEHDRLLLWGVFLHGYTRYEDIKIDPRFIFRVDSSFKWQKPQKIQSQVVEQSKKGSTVKKKGRKSLTQPDTDEKAGDKVKEALIGEEIVQDEGKKQVELMDLAERKENLEFLNANIGQGGITFPSADALTKRVRRLVETPRPHWLRSSKNVLNVPVSFRLKRTSKKCPDSQLPAKRRRKELVDALSQTPWTCNEVNAFVHALCCFGVQLEMTPECISPIVSFQRIIAYMSLDPVKAASCMVVLRHICDEFIMRKTASLVQTTHPTSSTEAYCMSAIILELPNLISLEEGAHLHHCLLMFAQLRARVLPLGEQTFLSLMKKHSHMLNLSPMLETFEWQLNGVDDWALMVGLNKHGSSAWLNMLNDTSLTWSRSNKDAFKECSEQLSHILFTRASEVVTLISSLSPLHKPLSGTFSQFISFLSPPTIDTSLSSAVSQLWEGVRWDEARETRILLPSLAFYESYLSSLPSIPPGSLVSSFDVTSLSVSAISSQYPVWLPLVRHRQILFADQPHRLAITSGGIQDLYKTLNSCTTVYPLIVQPSLEPFFPLYLPGGLVVLALGSLDARCLFSHLKESDNIFLCPIGFASVRVHQSVVDPNRMALYRCEICEVDVNTVMLDDENAQNRCAFSSLVKQENSEEQTLTNGIKEEYPGTRDSSLEDLKSEVKDTNKLMEVENADKSSPLPPATPQQPLAASNAADTKILPNQDRIAFRVTCSDLSQSPMIASSGQAAWSFVDECIYNIVQAPAISRANNSHGYERYGLAHPLVRSLIEKLPNADTLPAFKKQPPINTQIYVQRQNLAAANHKADTTVSMT